MPRVEREGPQPGVREGRPIGLAVSQANKGKRHLQAQKGLSWQEHGVSRELQPKHELVGNCPSGEVDKGKFMKDMPRNDSILWMVCALEGLRGRTSCLCAPAGLSLEALDSMRAQLASESPTSGETLLGQDL